MRGIMLFALYRAMIPNHGKFFYEKRHSTYSNFSHINAAVHWMHRPRIAPPDSRQ